MGRRERRERRQHRPGGQLYPDRFWLGCGVLLLAGLGLFFLGDFLAPVLTGCVPLEGWAGCPLMGLIFVLFALGLMGRRVLENFGFFAGEPRWLKNRKEEARQRKEARRAAAEEDRRMIEGPGPSPDEWDQIMKRMG